MARLAHPLFPHRHNADGSYDSICTECAATVATTRTEDQLYLPELSHMCDPLRLYHFGEGSRPLDPPQSRRRAAEN
jgi:hypothetical protein